MLDFSARKFVVFCLGNMIQITKNGLQILETTQIDDLKREFAETNCLFLPNFLENSILASLQKRIDSTSFVPKSEGGDEAKFGEILFVPPHEPVLFIFHLLLNKPQLFQIIRQITDCAQVENFMGRIHRSRAGGQHFIEWHGDNSDNRLIGLTVNLGSETYTGGNFQLREKKSEKTTREIGRISAGDAFVFRIAPHLEHRLTALNEGVRTVGVGWFRSHPDWTSFARSRFQISMPSATGKAREN
jgi:hypothetical protein